MTGGNIIDCVGCGRNVQRAEAHPAAAPGGWTCWRCHRAANPVVGLVGWVLGGFGLFGGAPGGGPGRTTGADG